MYGVKLLDCITQVSVETGQKEIILLQATEGYFYIKTKHPKFSKISWDHTSKNGIIIFLPAHFSVFINLGLFPCFHFTVDWGKTCLFIRYNLFPLPHCDFNNQCKQLNYQRKQFNYSFSTYHINQYCLSSTTIAFTYLPFWSDTVMSNLDKAK